MENDENAAAETAKLTRFVKRVVYGFVLVVLCWFGLRITYGCHQREERERLARERVEAKRVEMIEEQERARKYRDEFYGRK